VSWIFDSLPAFRITLFACVFRLLLFGLFAHVFDPLLVIWITTLDCPMRAHPRVSYSDTFEMSSKSNAHGTI